VENAIKALGILFQRRANKIYEGPWRYPFPKYLWLLSLSSQWK
jgi:hypothetical protein